MLRKLQLEAWVRRAVDEGRERLVVLGAGFDTLALRLAVERPEHRFIEIDRPSTQRAKRRRLAALPPNLELVPVADLTGKPPDEVLPAVALRDPGRTLFLAEASVTILSHSDDESTPRLALQLLASIDVISAP